MGTEENQELQVPQELREGEQMEDTGEHNGILKRN